MRCTFLSAILFPVVVLIAALVGTLATAQDFQSQTTDDQMERFETAGVGRFESYQSDFGRWVCQEGEVAIDHSHAKTGKSCLHLGGGSLSVVTLRLASPVAGDHLLRFWAERWTSRPPFSFRVEKETVDGWEEVFNGDSKVRVGRAFLNDVKFTLGEDPVERLRFSCSSPPQTGILIDDMQITPLRPQRITGIRQIPFTLPALIGDQAAPLAKLQITTEGSLQPLHLRTVATRLLTSHAHATFRGVFLSPHPGGVLPAGSALLRPETPAGFHADQTLTLRTDSVLAEGENTVWVNAFLDPDLPLETRVGAQLINAACEGRREPISIEKLARDDLDLEKAALPGALVQRLGVAIREGGDDGVHTFRIPGLATTQKGTLIAVYDIRHRGGGDLPNHIDIGMSRSVDGGRHWEPMQTIMDMGSDPRWRFDGIGDPAVLVDQKTGTIWVAATWSHGNRSWLGSGPGLKPEETGQVMLVRSDDDGVTWSQPINITEQIKDSEWCFVLPGPGRGITMQDGTIVFAAQYQDPPARRRLPHSTIMYSKDHGVTWEIGTGAWDDTTESQVAEISPGVLMLNCRYNRKDRRVVMITRDMGKTWEKHSTSELSLIEPRACMASLLRPFPSDQTSRNKWLLFSNPDSTVRRERLTIKASRDLGDSWQPQHQILLDEGVSAGYSCMTMIDSEHLGILYEGSQAHLTFQRIPIQSVFDEREAAR